jgi:hypothetical protein
MWYMGVMQEIKLWDRRMHMTGTFVVDGVRNKYLGYLSVDNVLRVDG